MTTLPSATAAAAASARGAGLSADEALFLQTVPWQLLAALAAGSIDVPAMAREELAARGVDASGRWVGFDRAAEIHQVR